MLLPFPQLGISEPLLAVGSWSLATPDEVRAVPIANNQIAKSGVSVFYAIDPFTHLHGFDNERVKIGVEWANKGAGRS